MAAAAVRRLPPFAAGPAPARGQESRYDLELTAGRVALVPVVRFAGWFANLNRTSLRFESWQVEVLLGLVF